MIGEISSIAGMTGYGHTEVRKSLDAGTETQESKEARFAKRLKIEATTVMPVSESEHTRDYNPNEINEKTMQYYIDQVRRLIDAQKGNN